MNKILICITIVLTLFSIWSYTSYKAYGKERDILTANVKAYENGILRYKDKLGKEIVSSRILQKNLSDVKDSKDKDVLELQRIIKEQKIKLSNVSTIGTIETRIDTVFTPTSIKDSCYYFNLGEDMKAEFCIRDSLSTYRPYITNKVYLIFSSKKEAINTPSKLFFIRWFQKKHTVVNATLVNSNKYVLTDRLNFTYIIK